MYCLLHHTQLSPPELHNVFRYGGGFRAGERGTCPRNDIRITLAMHTKEQEGEKEQFKLMLTDVKRENTGYRE